MRNSTVNGFTLIEVMIVVVIVGILASIAYPNYSSYVNRAARADAMVILLDAANRQEQFFVDNRQYTSDLADLGVPTETENGYFTIGVEADTSSFTVTATADSGPVAGDTECSTLTINELGLKGNTGSGDADLCWER
ncbi:type IV pilus assembly protein PilE [Pseudoalteromonas citrea]|uniref:Type IV pilus assembly protein PilE n=2 Tax=Pseudoalteromonas citrea TaxID=43655 RepID=A0AAD4ALB6_9GAMM|nr:type IV pilin protein [Pseudoalteromonas citrea]KAF7774260.1 type IV pilus assembly protein PilE [Pseudoalteromonas citrea]